MSMATTMRAGVGVVGVAALLLAVSPVAAAAPPRCATTGLQVSQGLNQAAAGTASTVFALRNASGRTCLLGGYPGMAFRVHGNDNEWKYVTVRRGGSTAFRDPGAKVITLAPGGSASYSLAYTAPQTSTCRRTGQVRVTPPGATTSLTLRTPGQNVIWVCPGMPMTVSALVAGRRGAPG